MHKEDADVTLAQALAEVPFEELQRLKSQGMGGPPPSTRREKGEGGTGGGALGVSGSAVSHRRRANKNRPMEVSSKRPVSRFREVIEAPKPAVRDPRFETLCGEFDEARFKKSYRFLYDETMPQEAQLLKKALKKEKAPERKAELKQKLSEIERSRQGEERRRKREEEEAERKTEQREHMETGKTPYFLSKSKRKHEELVEKFKELKAQGKLEAFLAKKRRKNAAKEHKRVPLERRS